MKKLLPLLCACLALVAVGCGGGDDNKSSGGGGGGGGAAAPAKTTSGGGGAKSADVTLKDIQFSPATVTVAKGGTVKWANDDSVGHDVTADDGSFKSGSPGGLSSGDTFSHKFAKAGTFKYVCTVHSGMKGTVLVK